MALGRILQAATQFQDIGGKNDVSGLLYVYKEPRSERATLRSVGQGTVLPNPLVINAAGLVEDFVVDDASLYWILLTDFDGNELFTRHNLSVFGSGSGGGQYFPGQFIDINDQKQISVKPTKRLNFSDKFAVTSDEQSISVDLSKEYGGDFWEEIEISPTERYIRPKNNVKTVFGNKNETSFLQIFDGHAVFWDQTEENYLDNASDHVVLGDNEGDSYINLSKIGKSTAIGIASTKGSITLVCNNESGNSFIHINGKNVVPVAANDTGAAPEKSLEVLTVDGERFGVLCDRCMNSTFTSFVSATKTAPYKTESDGYAIVRAPTSGTSRLLFLCNEKGESGEYLSYTMADVSNANFVRIFVPKGMKICFDVSGSLVAPQVANFVKIVNY